MAAQVAYQPGQGVPAVTDGEKAVLFTFAGGVAVELMRRLFTRADSRDADIASWRKELAERLDAERKYNAEIQLRMQSRIDSLETKVSDLQTQLLTAQSRVQQLEHEKRMLEEELLEQTEAAVMAKSRQVELEGVIAGLRMQINEANRLADDYRTKLEVVQHGRPQVAERA